MSKEDVKRILSDTELDTVTGGAKTNWIATCLKCKWTYSSSDAVLLDAMAAQHTQETGHNNISKVGMQG